jgi:hypothetical protein
MPSPVLCSRCAGLAPDAKARETSRPDAILVAAACFLLASRARGSSHRPSLQLHRCLPRTVTCTCAAPNAAPYDSSPQKTFSLEIGVVKFGCGESGSSHERFLSPKGRRYCSIAAAFPSARKRNGQGDQFCTDNPADTWNIGEWASKASEACFVKGPGDGADVLQSCPTSKLSGCLRPDPPGERSIAKAFGPVINLREQTRTVCTTAAGPLAGGARPEQEMG